MSEVIRTEGQVKWWSEQKGFGMISSADGDVFVHHSEIKTGDRRRVNLAEGQTVRFEVSKGPKGLKAQKVEIVLG